MGCSAENRLNSRLSAIREKMRVSPPHGFSRVPNETVDEPLVHTFTRQIADEAMPQTMPAADLGPLAATERPGEMIARLRRRDRGWASADLLASCNCCLAKGIIPTRMVSEPLVDCLSESRRHGYATGRLLPADPLELVDYDFIPVKIGHLAAQ